MKKQWFIMLCSLLLAAVLCLGVSWPRDGGSTLLPSILPTRPTATSPTTQPSTGEPTLPSRVGLYVCHREDPAVYEALAQQYTEQTGIDCQVLTGQLESLMGSDTPPTIFCVHNREEAQRWQLLDLADSAVLAQLYSPSFALALDGIYVGLAMDVDSYGLIFNAALLAQAGYTRTDITDFASLQAVVEHITADKKVLGFQAFGAVESGKSLAAFLAGTSREPERVRQVLDLYIANAKPSGDPMKQFVAGQTVFYMGGIADYSAVADMGIHNLDMLPMFTADGGSIQCVCDTYWCVNAQASGQDQQASLDFLAWLVTAGEDDTVPVDAFGWLSPFADADWVENAFERSLRKHLAAESVTLRWSQWEGRTTMEWMDLSEALADYAATATDENWEKVASLLNNP